MISSRRTRQGCRPILLALLAVLALASCAVRPPAPVPPAESHIVIFHINDTHAKIDAFAKVAAILDAERKAGSEVFFFSAGDIFTGDPVVDRYDPPGRPIVEILDRLGLDLLTIGNHEFDYGQDALKDLLARFRTVSANIEAQAGVLPGLEPAAVLKTRDGLRLVVFGLIQVEPGNGLPSSHPDKLRGLQFSEPLARAAGLKRLRGEGEILIGLTHIGYLQDLALARQWPQIDVIVGGHSHTKVDPAENVEGVLVTQAGSDNRFLGRIDLHLRGGRIVEKKGVLIDLGRTTEEDAGIKALIAGFRQNPALARVVAQAPFEIGGKDALGSLMSDAIRRAHGLDVAFQNNGGIRLNRLPQAISLKDVYTLEPFGNPVVRFDMTAAEIRGLVRSSFERNGAIDLQVSGLSYVVRTDDEKRVLDVQLRLPDGSPLAEDRTYSVGLSSYIASSYAFDHKDPGRSLQSTVADALLGYLEGGADLGVYTRDLVRARAEKDPGASDN
jgi:5'-nucleotidase/UDP-sugar diphosphatase